MKKFEGIKTHSLEHCVCFVKRIDADSRSTSEETSLDEWKPKLQYFMYKSFADLRCEIYFFVLLLNKTTYNCMVKVMVKAN